MTMKIQTTIRLISIAIHETKHRLQRNLKACDFLEKLQAFLPSKAYAASLRSYLLSIKPQQQQMHYALPAPVQLHDQRRLYAQRTCF